MPCPKLKVLLVNQITSTELTRVYLARLKKYQNKLQFVVNLTETHALRQAVAAGKEIREGRYRGILHGILFGAKDLLAQHEYPITFGAPIYKNRIFNIDAAVIEKLESAAPS